MYYRWLFEFHNNSEVLADTPRRKQGSQFAGSAHGNPMTVGVDLNDTALKTHQAAAGRDDSINAQHIRVEVHRQPRRCGSRSEMLYH